MTDPTKCLNSFSALSEAEISDLILSHRPTSCPLDPVPSPLFQTISPSIITFLLHVLNSSLTSGTFPSAFKQARVRPLLKKPSLNPAVLQNYRPVSLLPFFSKTIERAVSNQLSNFLTQNNLLDPHQSGFKTGHSTETALLSVTTALQSARAASRSSVIILLDLSAAFDTVNHRILLARLSEMGITGTALQWISSYLSGRSYQVSWGGDVSDPRQLSTGVPQGSVLGPLLFSLYTTSLGPIITSHGFSYHCYADDTQLYLSFPPTDPGISARIEACLTDISAWMTKHHLQLNLAKTELLIIPAKPSISHDLSITLGSATVTPSSSARNLGVTMDDELSLTAHIAAVSRSCRFTLYNIRKIRRYLSEHSTQLLVQALVLSKLDYCNSLLAGLPACATRPLQRIQNAAARLVFNLPRRSHVTPLLVSLHWLPVTARIRFKTLVLTFRAVNGTAPDYIKSLLQPYTPSRHLRSSSDNRLVVPPLKTARSQHKLFPCLAPQWWNQLPTSIRDTDCLPTFKNRLKTHLFREYNGT